MGNRQYFLMNREMGHLFQRNHAVAYLNPAQESILATTKVNRVGWMEEGNELYRYTPGPPQMKMISIKPGQTLDLGCGDGKRGDIGVDHLPWPGVDAVVNLGFQPLPFDDNSFERVYAWDLLEHIPKAVYLPSRITESQPPRLIAKREKLSGDWDLRPGATLSRELEPSEVAWFPDSLASYRAYYPHIQLFNEAWRVLNPDGIFDTFTPILEPAVNGRLFHVSVWNEAQFEQFTELGTDFRRGHMQMNGLIARFEIVHREPENHGLHIHFKAIK